MISCLKTSKKAISAGKIVIFFVGYMLSFVNSTSFCYRRLNLEKFRDSIFGKKNFCSFLNFSSFVTFGKKYNFRFWTRNVTKITETLKKCKINIRKPVNGGILLRKAGNCRYFATSYRALCSFFGQRCAFIVENLWTKVRLEFWYRKHVVVFFTRWRIFWLIIIRCFQLEHPACTELKKFEIITKGKFKPSITVSWSQRVTYMGLYVKKTKHIFIFTSGWTINILLILKLAKTHDSEYKPVSFMKPGFSKLQEVGICVNRELNISDFLEKQANERFELVS